MEEGHGMVSNGTTSARLGNSAKSFCLYGSWWVYPQYLPTSFCLNPTRKRLEIEVGALNSSDSGQTIIETNDDLGRDSG